MDYASLKTSVAIRSGRDDIAPLLDDFISLAEEGINEALRVREMESTASLTSSTRFVTLPDGFLAFRRVRPKYNGSYYRDLIPKSLQAIHPLDQSAIPSEYAISGASLELDRIPLGTLEVNFYKRVAALSATNTTNDILTNYPKVYIHGVLAEIYSYSEETKEEAKHRVSFQGAIADANKLGVEQMGATPVIRVEGVTP